jgi:hypothetical protein
MNTVATVDYLQNRQFSFKMQTQVIGKKMNYAFKRTRQPQFTSHHLLHLGLQSIGARALLVQQLLPLM